MKLEENSHSRAQDVGDIEIGQVPSQCCPFYRK